MSEQARYALLYSLEVIGGAHNGWYGPDVIKAYQSEEKHKEKMWDLESASTRLAQLKKKAKDDELRSQAAGR